MIAIFALFLILAIYGPSLWIRYTLHRFSNDDPAIPGTGGELAEHLIKRFELSGVNVEQTSPGQDHYDPQDNAVRLSPTHFNGRSLTAVAVAAHEVGHAIQFNREETISQLRGKYMPRAAAIKRAGILIITLMPFVTLLLKVPQVMLVMVVIGILTMLASAFMYLIVLPEEWDASFNKALPILKEGNYITAEQETAIRSVLRAAALTYFAAALADVLSLWRWIALLKR